MKRALLALVPLLVMAPHMIPAPDQKVEGRPPPPPAQTLDDPGRLPDAARMEQLARTDPVAFLQYCILRHDREVKGYSATMQKQERIDGRLEKKEVIETHYKVEPHSVFLRWREGQRLAARALYVAGQNDGQVVIKPAGLGSFLKSVTRDPEGPDARRSGRYTLKEFGLRMALARTLGSWQAAQKDGTLHVEYGGKVKVKEAGDRECYKLHRTKFAKPEGDGSTDLTMYVDVETWLPLGTVLKGEDGRLIGEYYFRDLRLNPEFARDQFTPAAVTAK